jgi:hypothetical protein
MTMPVSPGTDASCSATWEEPRTRADDCYGTSPPGPAESGSAAALWSAARV